MAPNTAANDLTGAHAICRHLPFLDLPGEQRNQIYRYLLDDIATPDKDLAVWENLPKHKDRLSTYAALIRTCRTVNSEVTSIFEAEYLPKMTLYFDDFSEFHKHTNAEAKNGLKVSTAKFVLRTPLIHTSPTLGLQAMRLLVSLDFDEQMFSAFDNPKFWHNSAQDIDYVDQAGLGSVRKETIRGVQYRTMIYPRVLSENTRLTVFARVSVMDILGEGQIKQVMEGRFCDLTWRGYDSEDGRTLLEEVTNVWSHEVQERLKPMKRGYFDDSDSEDCA